MAVGEHPSVRWLAGLRRGRGPIYRAIVDALEQAIRAGELQPGDQLPPQRVVAQRLDVDLTTVTRAYASARDRGLLEGAVGRGTFVRSLATEDEAGLVDLTMNLPPPPQGVSLGALMGETVAAVLARTDPAALMAYHPSGGSLGQKLSAASWLAPSLGDISPERVMISPGAQTALAAVLSAILRGRTGTLVVEPLVYPGLLTLARALGLKLAVCMTDEGGMRPDSLAEVCAREGAVAVYVTPTLQNPTAVTQDLQRRRDIAAVARAADLWIIEDDPYARLLEAPIPAIASLAPERTFHIATLSKSLSPGLRTAFVAAPANAISATLADSLRAVALMASPLMSAVVSAWIREGQADKLLAGVRREARARRAIAAEVLPQAKGSADGIHVWIDMPAGWDAGRVHRLAQEKGVSLVTASAFAAGEQYPEGLRISLGGPARQTVLRGALDGVAAVIGGAASPRLIV